MASTSMTSAEISERQLYAAIDVGTNSVKLVIADLGGGRAERVFETTMTTRIGEGMQAHGMRLREIPMRRTLDALADFADITKQHNVLNSAAVGTAALRDAANSSEFLGRVKERCGIDIEIIPGEEEARLSYLAVRRDPHWRDSTRLLVIDVGGGSTEIIQGEPGTDRVASRMSINLGAVKLTESFLMSDPPTVAQLEAANQAASDACSKVKLLSVGRDVSSIPIEVVGVGGTLTNLGAMVRGIARINPNNESQGVGSPPTPNNGGAVVKPPIPINGGAVVKPPSPNNGGVTNAHSDTRHPTLDTLTNPSTGQGASAELMHGFILNADDIERQMAILAVSSIEQRNQIVGLDPRRADIILGGAIMLSQALSCIGSGKIAISTRGLRWGLLYDRFAKEVVLD